MAGEIFVLGETKTRPGTYVRVTNTGEPPVKSGAKGIVAAIIESSWGPLNQVVTLNGLNEVFENFGEGNGPEVIKELFRGGALTAKVVRGGTGGSQAQIILQDTTATTPVNVVTLTTKYPTSRSFNLTIKDSDTDNTKRELLVYEGSMLLESAIEFVKGSTEPADIVAAVNNNSKYLTAVKDADGNGALASVTNQALIGGTDPVINLPTDYDTGFTTVEAEVFNAIVTDSEDTTVYSALQSYVSRLRNEGKRIITAVGQATSVALATRLNNAKLFNDYAMVYILNGFNSANGVVEGAKAAARVIGEIMATSYKTSLTHQVIEGASSVVGKLTNAQIVDAINSGAIAFTENTRGQVQIEYGITTFITPDVNYDEGWKKIRRVRTRDELINRVVYTLDPYIGKLDNSADGRATVVSVINGIIQDMVAEGGLLGGQAMVDPTNNPAGDSAWFSISVDDLDSMEKVYFTFGFRFTAEQ